MKDIVLESTYYKIQKTKLWERRANDRCFAWFIKVSNIYGDFETHKQTLNAEQTVRRYWNVLKGVKCEWFHLEYLRILELFKVNNKYLSFSKSFPLSYVESVFFFLVIKKNKSKVHNILYFNYRTHANNII